MLVLNQPDLVGGTAVPLPLLVFMLDTRYGVVKLESEVWLVSCEPEVGVDAVARLTGAMIWLLGKRVY